jgi:hypothetical protein
MDVMHMHKIMGFGCLAHYGVRFYWKFKYGSMFFGPNDISPLIHLGLSLSSFIFKVPIKRFLNKTIIWKELQLHNIIFTSRSIFIIYHSLYFTNNNIYFYLTKLGIILSHHYLADIVSNKFINNDFTTTRYIRGDYGNHVIKKFYAISQIIATTNLLLITNPDSSFTIMFPIQLSAFLMTLVRKGIISNNLWHIFYTSSLILPFILFNKNIINNSNNIHLYSLIHIFLRLGIKTNKYSNMIFISSLFIYDKFIRNS